MFHSSARVLMGAQEFCRSDGTVQYSTCYCRLYVAEEHFMVGVWIAQSSEPRLEIMAEFPTTGKCGREAVPEETRLLA